jgi:hypothetical protein
MRRIIERLGMRTLPQHWWRTNTARFLIVVVVVNLHLLRNVSAPGYLALYAVVALWSFWHFLITDRVRALQDRGWIAWLWIVLGIAAAIVTALVGSLGGALYGLLRFLFVMPVFFAAVAFTDTREQLRRNITSCVAVFAVASLTLPLQFLTGPINFFAPALVRGADVRYSSLVGSVTSEGIAVGLFVLMAPAARRWWPWVLVAAMGLPAMLSLSKAAVANLGLAAAGLLVAHRRDRRFLIPLALIPPLATMAVIAAPPLRERFLSTVSTFTEIAPTASNNYDPALPSVLERLTNLPAANWAALTSLKQPLLQVIGAGYGMGSTALAPRSDTLGPMAHNQVVESMSVHGIVGGTILWSLLTVAFCSLLLKAWRTRRPLDECLAMAMGMVLLNSLTANGTLYQPATGTAVMMLLYYSVAKLRDPHDPGVGPADPRKGSDLMEFSEILSVLRRRWRLGTSVGVGVALALAAYGLLMPASRLYSAWQDYEVTVIFVPTAATSTASKEASKYIEKEMPAFAEVALNPEVQARAFESSGVDRGDSRLGGITLAYAGDHSFHLIAGSNTEPLVTAFLNAWAAETTTTIEATVLPDNGQATVSARQLGEPELSYDPSNVPKVTSRTLALPLAPVLGLLVGVGVSLSAEASSRRRRAAQSTIAS